jgi:hypothetical protein
MPTWPTSGGFPQAPRVGSWVRTAADTVTEFKPAVGAPRVRRLVSAAQYDCQGTFQLTEAQVETLMDFWAADCDLGALTFTWTDPEDGTTARTWEWAAVPQISHLTAGVFEAAVSLIRQS